MKRLFLTSTGLSTSELQKRFFDEVDMPAENIKVLFIPTAAVDDEAKAVLPLCRDDVLNLGVPEKNITVYDLDRNLTEEEIAAYNMIYVCGGSPEYLLSRMNAVGFSDTLKTAFEHDVIYIGVSAGSIVCGANLSDNLGYCEKTIGVHCTTHICNGERIDLTDNQALFVKDAETYIIN
ncbi:MAG: Type 1 glutamine amidotransferase-like domain-containing protein [Eubacterium sp.]|nr:Type 1 glutamine amidotransferase-like domain-containing protein [Eubacterium sp.]